MNIIGYINCILVGLLLITCSVTVLGDNGGPSPVDKKDGGAVLDAVQPNDKQEANNQAVKSSTTTITAPLSEKTTVAPSSSGENCTKLENGTEICRPYSTGPGGGSYIKNLVSDNRDMLMRTFYVLIGITGIIVVYFVVKTIRMNRRKNRTKRYGLLASRDDNLEMAPLDGDDDEDDMTVFDINNHPK